MAMYLLFSSREPCSQIGRAASQLTAFAMSAGQAGVCCCHPQERLGQVDDVRTRAWESSSLIISAYRLASKDVQFVHGQIQLLCGLSFLLRLCARTEW